MVSLAKLSGNEDRLPVWSPAANRSGEIPSVASHHMSPTRFSKEIDGAPEPVKVDLISGQYTQGGKSTSIAVNEPQIRAVRGIDLAFEACDEIPIAGVMPAGSQNEVRARIVRSEAFVLINAFALDERTREKDAYDTAFVLRHCEPDLATLAERIRRHPAYGLGREAYGILKNKFAALSSVGPKRAAEAVPGTGEDFEQLQRSADEDAQELFHLVDDLAP